MPSPREVATNRILTECEGLSSVEIDAALQFIDQNRDSDTAGTGNLADLLIALPELENVADDAECLSAFLDLVEAPR